MIRPDLAPRIESHVVYLAETIAERALAHATIQNMRSVSGARVERALADADLTASSLYQQSVRALVGYVADTLNAAKQPALPFEGEAVTSSNA